MEHGRSQGDRRSSQDGVQTGVLPGVLAPLLTIAPPPCRPFRQWYEAHYGVEIGRKKKGGGKKKDGDAEADAKKSSHVLRKVAQRQKGRTLESTLNDQFTSGRLLAVVSSRPGQSGRCDGYILEGPELAFYKRKLDIKKKK